MTKESTGRESEKQEIREQRTKDERQQRDEEKREHLLTERNFVTMELKFHREQIKKQICLRYSKAYQIILCHSESESK